jgi:hypothetical protein
MLILAACQSANPQSTKVSDLPTEQTETVLSTPGNDPADGIALANPTQGIEAYASYHQHFELTLTGTQQGTPYESTQVIDRDVQDSNETLQVNQSGTNDAAMQFIEARIDGYRYTQDTAGASCRAEKEQTDRVVDNNPVSRLPVVADMQKIGREEINGLAAMHFTFDEHSLPDPDGILKTANGDVWMAEDGGAVLKYTLSMEIATQEFSGTRTWDYELDQIDQLQAVQLPDACQPVLADLPMLPEAADVRTLPGFLSYTAPSSRAVAVSFYYNQLTSLGWQSLPGSTPDTANLSSALTVISYTQDYLAGSRVLVLRLDEIDGQLRVVAQTVLIDQPILVKNDSPAVTTTTDLPPADEITSDSSARLPADLPIYPGATVLMQIDSVLMAEVQASSSDVIAFYQEALESGGWVVGEETESAGVILFTASREKDTLMVTAMETNGITQVTLTAVTQ